MNKANIIGGFADFDWAGDRVDRKSTSGYVFNIFGNPVICYFKKQITVAFSTEAEYTGCY